MSSENQPRPKPKNIEYIPARHSDIEPKSDSSISRSKSRVNRIDMDQLRKYKQERPPDPPGMVTTYSPSAVALEWETVDNAQKNEEG